MDCISKPVKNLSKSIQTCNAVFDNNPTFGEFIAKNSVRIGLFKKKLFIVPKFDKNYIFDVNLVKICSMVNTFEMATDIETY